MCFVYCDSSIVIQPLFFILNKLVIVLCVHYKRMVLRGNMGSQDLRGTKGAGGLKKMILQIGFML